MRRLTDKAVRAAEPGRYGDGNGLFLVVSPSNRRKWVFRFQVQGKRQDMGLGAYPAVGLADARSATADARKLIVQGIDPIEHRRAARRAIPSVPTFGEIAELVIADAQKKSANEKVRYQWSRHLGPVYVGSLLPIKVNAITTLDVAACLQTVWREKPEVARKLYPAIRRVFEYARIRLRDDFGLSMDNPAAWHDLKAVGFEAPAKLSRGRHPSLSYLQMPAFMADLRSHGSQAALALELLILTNVRTDAVLKAHWDDFDLTAAVWTVPLHTLKDRKYRTQGFRVPLSNRAVSILTELKGVKSSLLVFPARRSEKTMSNMALLSVLKRMNAGPAAKWIDRTTGRPVTAHGFRATFRTWAEEITGFPHAVIEEAMGHQVGTEVERAYRRTDVLEKRRKLMAAWAQHCDFSVLSNVRKIKAVS